MPFWKRTKRKSEAPPPDTGQVQPARTTRRRSPPAALEVKLLAIEALESGADKKDVAEVIGVGPSTLGTWLKQYREGGVQGLCRRASSIAVRKQCSVLEQKIICQRQQHPDRGVRRIRDELQRHEGLSVRAEQVRQTVNEAGLGNPPPQPGRRLPQTRRFERSLPNAMWQIDIFTFQLKRMYRVYLIGIIEPNFEYLGEWLEENHLTKWKPDDLEVYKGMSQEEFEAAMERRRKIIEMPEVIAFYNQILEETQKNLSGFEKIKRFALVADDWNEYNVLTPSMKMKRRIIVEDYKNLLDKIYVE